MATAFPFIVLAVCIAPMFIWNHIVTKRRKAAARLKRAYQELEARGHGPAIQSRMLDELAPNQQKMAG